MSLPEIDFTVDRATGTVVIRHDGEVVNSDMLGDLIGAVVRVHHTGEPEAPRLLVTPETMPSLRELGEALRSRNNTLAIPFAASIQYADDFEALYVTQAEVGNEKFGDEFERGPLGTLKHLLKEVWTELIGAPDSLTLAQVMEFEGLGEGVDDETEWADALILLVDAHRRATRRLLRRQGVEGAVYTMYAMALLKAALAKVEVNRQRVWPRAEGDETRPVEHDRTGERPQIRIPRAVAHTLQPGQHVCPCGATVTLEDFEYHYAGTDQSGTPRGYKGVIPQHDRPDVARVCGFTQTRVSTNFARFARSEAVATLRHEVQYMTRDTLMCHTCERGVIRTAGMGEKDWERKKQAFIQAHDVPLDVPCTEPAATHMVTKMDMPGGNETYQCGPCGTGITRFAQTGDDAWAKTKAEFYTVHGYPVE
jgi:hypothetical protein